MMMMPARTALGLGPQGLVEVHPRTWFRIRMAASLLLWWCKESRFSASSGKVPPLALRTLTGNAPLFRPVPHWERPFSLWVTG